MLSTTATMLMGNQLVSIDVLRRVLSSSSKLLHGLVSSDLNPRDHQNYSSCWKISRDEIFQVLETIEDSNATAIYIKILRSVIDAYIEKSTCLLDRIFHAWISVFLSRLWMIWTHKMGKTRLDSLLIELTQHDDDSRNLSKTNMQQYSLTPQAVYSLELNAHCLVYLVLLVIEGKLPEEVLAVDRFHSQSCEAIFRSARAFSSKTSSGANFTVLQFMNLADKLSLFQKIKTRHEKSTPPLIRFPVHHKNNLGHSLPLDPSSHASLPTKALVEATIKKSFEKAIEYADQVGMMGFLRKHKLSNINSVNDYARMLFDEKKILDDFSQDSDDDDNDNDGDDNDQDHHQAHEGEVDESSEDEIESSVLRFHDDPDSVQPTFRGMRVCEKIPSHLSGSYFKICINGNDKFIHKSSACWVLTEQNQKLSSDRTKRVTQAK